MGRWKGATFKEYVHKALASFSEAMSTKMKQKFHFVNVAGNSMYNVTETIIASEYCLVWATLKSIASSTILDL